MPVTVDLIFMAYCGDRYRCRKASHIKGLEIYSAELLAVLSVSKSASE